MAQGQARDDSRGWGGERGEGEWGVTFKVAGFNPDKIDLTGVKDLVAAIYSDHPPTPRPRPPLLCQQVERHPCRVLDPAFRRPSGKSREGRFRRLMTVIAAERDDYY